MGSKDQGATATDNRWLVIPRTLSFITHGTDVLLLKRAPHKRVFPNKYNGLGGHIERHEDPQTSAIREIHEETNIPVKNVQFRGVHHIDTGHTNGIILMIYTAEATTRDFVNSEEGTLEWVPLNEIQTKDLVEDIMLLMDRLFGKNARKTPFAAHVSYDDDDQLIYKEG